MFKFFRSAAVLLHLFVTTQLRHTILNKAMWPLRTLTIRTTLHIDQV